MLAREVALSREAGCSFGLLIIDIDNFKPINDIHGQDAGDEVLQAIAQTLQERARSSDFVFRYSGEEFVVVLADLQPENLWQAGEQFRRAVAQSPVRLPTKGDLHVTVSVDAAAYTGHPDLQLLLKTADQALYRAKHEGKNRTCIFPKHPEDAPQA